MSLTLLVIYFYLSTLIAIFYSKREFIAVSMASNGFFSFITISMPPLLIGFYFVGLRPLTAGGDTIPYLIAFSKISSPLTATADANYGSELLFWPVQAIMKSLTNARGWLVLNYLCIVLLTYYAYRKITKETGVSALIFSMVFLTFFGVYTGNAMRQVYSIPLGIIAFYLCQQKDYSKYLLFSGFAVAFHWSASILLLAPIFTRIPKSIAYYLIVPLLALALSQLMPTASRIIASVTEFDWVSSSNRYYVEGVRKSHIEAVWKTLNFWLCIAIYLLLLMVKLKSKKYGPLENTFLMIISIMFFTISNPDISERFMVWLIFLLPLAMAVVFLNLKISQAWKSVLLMTFFAVMAILVFSRESSISTLGIN